MLLNMKKATVLFIIIFVFFALSIPQRLIATSKTTKTMAVSQKNKVIKKIIKPASKKQVIKATITWDDGLLPTDFTVKAGLPVRFEIDPKDDIEGCMSTILIPDLYEKYSFVEAGQKIVMEFTPKKIGAYDITCAMGVPWGTIKVVK